MDLEPVDDTGTGNPNQQLTIATDAKAPAGKTGKKKGKKKKSQSKSAAAEATSARDGAIAAAAEAAEEIAKVQTSAIVDVLRSNPQFQAVMKNLAQANPDLKRHHLEQLRSYFPIVEDNPEAFDALFDEIFKDGDIFTQEAVAPNPTEETVAFTSAAEAAAVEAQARAKAVGHEGPYPTAPLPTPPERSVVAIPTTLPQESVVTSRGDGGESKNGLQSADGEKEGDRKEDEVEAERTQVTEPELMDFLAPTGSTQYAAANKWPKGAQGGRVKTQVAQVRMAGVEVHNLAPPHPLAGQQGLFAVKPFAPFDVIGEYQGEIKEVSPDLTGEYTTRFENGESGQVRFYFVELCAFWLKLDGQMF